MFKMDNLIDFFMGSWISENDQIDTYVFLLQSIFISKNLLGLYFPKLNLTITFQKNFF